MGNFIKIDEVISMASMQLGVTNDNNRLLFLQWAAQSMFDMGWEPKVTACTAVVNIDEHGQAEKPCDYLFGEEIQFGHCGEGIDTIWLGYGIYKFSGNGYKSLKNDKWRHLWNDSSYYGTGFTNTLVNRYNFITFEEDDNYFRMIPDPEGYINVINLKYQGFPSDELGRPLIPEIAARAVEQYIVYMYSRLQQRKGNRNFNPQQEQALWIGLKAQYISEMNIPDYITALEIGNITTSLIQRVSRSRVDMYRQH